MLILISSSNYSYPAAAAKLFQSCPTLCNPIDGSPPGSPVPGILQARTLEWVAISSSNAWKWKVKVMSLSRVRLLATPWTAAYQAPPSMGFSRQEYWSGVPLPSLTLAFSISVSNNSTLQGTQFKNKQIKFSFLDSPLILHMHSQNSVISTLKSMSRIQSPLTCNCWNPCLTSYNLTGLLPWLPNGLLVSVLGPQWSKSQCSGQ